MIFDLPKHGVLPALSYMAASGREVPARFLLTSAYTERAELMVILPSGHLKRMDFATAVTSCTDDPEGGSI